MRISDWSSDVCSSDLLTAPRSEGQVRALDRAYAKAGFSPATLGLVEAHGTGTAVGDRAEAQTITRALAAENAEPASVAIGSVKTLLGHTKAAAGDRKSTRLNSSH